MRITLRTVVWLVLATVAAGFAGLGLASLRPSEDELAVERTVDAFLSAVGHNGAKACLRLTREAQARLTKRAHERSCPRAAERTVPAESSLVSAAEYDFGAIRWGPDHDWARVPSVVSDLPDLPAGLFGQDLFAPIYLEQGDGRWAIASLEWYFEY